jgi:hypothetical protein
LFSCYFDSADAAYPYKGWLYFANWGNDLEGTYFMRSADGKVWERGALITDAYAGENDTSYREIRHGNRVLRGPGDVTVFSPDPATGRFLGLFKFYSPEPLRNGNLLRSRAYLFLDGIDRRVDLEGLQTAELVPAGTEANGDMPLDEYYGSTAWRYESVWLGGLKVWHPGDDYSYSAAGSAFLKLLVSRDGLNWSKVAFPNNEGIPEVFIPNGEPGGNGGRNDGGYMTEFSQGPLRIGSELIYYYGASSFGKQDIAGGGIFRARLRLDGFVSVDAGALTTKPLRFAGRDLVINSDGPVTIDVIDEGGVVLGSAETSGDSLDHPVSFAGQALGDLAPRGETRLRFSVGERAHLYSFRIE